MASRDLLHRSKLDAFLGWLVDNGWELVPLTRKKREALIVAQAKHPNRQHPITIWDRIEGAHYSLLDRDENVVRRFIRETKEANDQPRS